MTVPACPHLADEGRPRVRGPAARHAGAPRAAPGLPGPACPQLADAVSPRVRALAPRQLVAAGWSQAKAGEALRLSQGMVSRHLSGPAPKDPVAQRLADDLVAALLNPPPAPPHGPPAYTG